METTAEAVRPDPAFLRQVEGVLGQKISPCFLCSKCSGGCPIAFAMDILPHRAVRMVQMGLKEQLLQSSTIWLCASCETCSTRCPNEVDLAGLMDALRQTALREGAPPAEPNVPRFHAAFLSAVKKRGRVHELGMLAAYRLKLGKLAEIFKDAGLGWQMFRRGKLKLLPSGIRRKAQVREIFRNSESTTQPPLK